MKKRKLGVFLPATIARSTLNELELLVGFFENMNPITTRPEWDHRLRELTIEALLCRAVDVFHDVLLSYCLCALEAMGVEGRMAALAELGSRRKKLNYDDMSGVKEALSDGLASMRDTGRLIGFDVSLSLEGLVGIRNCLVHRKGVADVKVLSQVPDEIRSSFALEVGKPILISPEAFRVATKEFKAFISSGERILNVQFGMRWETVDALFPGGTVRARRPNLMMRIWSRFKK